MDNTEQVPSRLHETYPPERKHIRWDPTINTGHMLSAGTSIIASLVFVMASWATMDKRVVILEEARLATQQANRDRQDQIKDKFDDVKTSLTELKVTVEGLRRDIQERKK